MSNFLDNLVARTLNLAPVVQPRIMSRFEPVSAATPVAPEQIVENDTPTERTERSERPATVHPEPRVNDPKPIIAAAPQVERQQPRVDFQQVLNTIRNTYVDSHEVVKVPVVEKVRERVLEETRIHTEKTDSRTEIRENRIVEPAREVDPNPSPPRLNIVEPAPVARKAPVTTPQPIVPPVVTRIEPAPVVKPPRFEVPPALPSDPTETINVTIGRVDVRAVYSQQATAPAARSRTATGNSLDDYLKQRSGGRR